MQNDPFCKKLRPEYCNSTPNWFTYVVHLPHHILHMNIYIYIWNLTGLGDSSAFLHISCSTGWIFFNAPICIRNECRFPSVPDLALVDPYDSNQQRGVCVMPACDRCNMPIFVLLRASNAHSYSGTDVYYYLSVFLLVPDNKLLEIAGRGKNVRSTSSNRVPNNEWEKTLNRPCVATRLCKNFTPRSTIVNLRTKDWTFPPINPVGNASESPHSYRPLGRRKSKERPHLRHTGYD